MKTIVFDFDKTLTYRDSLTQFFLGRMKGWRFIYLPYYICLKVFSKIGIISVIKEKELAMSLLCPKSESKINRLFLDFIDRINLSEVNERLYNEIDKNNKVIILSASPEIYLQKLYPKCEIIGLQFITQKGIKITQHPYGEEKLVLLKQHGISEVDEFYYDSKSDEAILPLCRKAYRISNGRIVEEKS